MMENLRILKMHSSFTNTKLYRNFKKKKISSSNFSAALKSKKIDDQTLRKYKIEHLKKLINNEDYINDAINKLANSLTSGFM